MNKTETEKLIAMIARWLMGIYFLLAGFSYVAAPFDYIAYMPYWVPIPFFWLFIGTFFWLIAGASFILNFNVRIIGSFTSIYMMFLAFWNSMYSASANFSLTLITVATYIALAGGALMAAYFSAPKKRHHHIDFGFRWGRILLGVFFFVVGILHFTNVSSDASMINFLPTAKLLVIFTGVCWIAAALSLWSGIIARLTSVLCALLIFIIILMITIPSFNVARAWQSTLAVLCNFALIGACLFVTSHHHIPEPQETKPE